jgi:REP element-mobilizing transposase RayT
VIYDIEFQRKSITQAAELTKRPLSQWEEEELEELHFRELNLQHHNKGARFLENPRIASIVADAFHYFDSKRYCLFAWVIMPTHIHIIVRPNNGYALSEIIHSWKSFTAQESNKILGRTGKFWHAEYYDHLVRDEEDFARCMQYLWSNPEEAKLTDWQWRWRRDKPAHRQDGDGTPA